MGPNVHFKQRSLRMTSKSVAVSRRQSERKPSFTNDGSRNEKENDAISFDGQKPKIRYQKITACPRFDDQMFRNRGHRGLSVISRNYVFQCGCYFDAIAMLMLANAIFDRSGLAVA